MQSAVLLSSSALYPAEDSELTRLVQQKPQMFQLKNREMEQGE